MDAALKASEERYRSVVEGSLQGILIHQDNRICFANEALARMFDYESAHELVGRLLWETFVLPENRVELQERTRDILSGKPVPPHPGWRAVGKHGRCIWVATTASRIEFQGRPAVVAFYLDITEQKQAEAALRRRLVDLTVLNRVGVICSEARTPDELLHRASALIAEKLFPDNCGFMLLDSARGVLVPHPSFVLTDPKVIRADVPLGTGITGQVAQTGLARRVGDVRTDPAYLAADGRTCSELCLPMKIGPKVVGVLNVESHAPDAFTPADEQLLGTVVDMVGNALERLRAEEAIRHSEERFRALAEKVQLIPWQADARTSQMTYVGPQAVAILGYALDDWCTPDFWKAHIHAEDAGWVAAYCMESSLSRDRYQLEYRMIARDGRTVWLYDLVHVVRDEHGPRILHGVLIDMTERKRAEEERRKLEVQIQHAQKLESLGVLAGGIAHDFNNLLTSMLGYASLALMQLPAESPACPMLHAIENAAQRAADLTQQMLAYSGRGHFVIQLLRLDTLVQEMTKLLQTVVSKKAAVALELAPATVEGDATQIRQIVMNLITNASEALEGNVGAIRIATGVRQADTAYLRSPFCPDELPAGPYAYVEVEDNGCGMSDATLPRIFDPFFTTKFTGRGLGLAAVLGIVRGHRGVIKVNSTPGRGTLFEVLLPCAAAPAPGSAASAREALLPRGQGTVLVVEDEPSVRDLARRVLESGGFQVRVADDGRHGLEMFERHRAEIEAVLLDLTMPHMDGLEVLRQLRSLDGDVPVLVMSGYSEQELATRFAGSGASGFIQKPFHPRGLLARLGQLLRSKTGSDQT
ncbi:MAG: PAS domain S-box protein [Gemmataceae bacterium]|nr:PAS domain S-box protein [Gemmataceae bacterium]